MTLLSRAHALSSGGLVRTAAAALTILPLSAAVADAAVSFVSPEVDYEEDLGVGHSGFVNDVDCGYSGIGDEGYYEFIVNIGSGTDSDADLFAGKYYTDRHGEIGLEPAVIGDFSPGDAVTFTADILTTLSFTSTTTVSYSVVVFGSDSAGNVFYAGTPGLTSMEDLFSHITLIPLGTGSVENSALLATPIELQYYKMTADELDTHGSEQAFIVNIYYDWDIEDSLGPGEYSTEEVLGMSFHGLLTVSSVPEPPTWGLLGGTLALGAAIVRRRRNRARWEEPVS